MNRRELLTTGLVSGGAIFLAGNLFAEDVTKSKVVTALDGFSSKELKLDSFEIVESFEALTESGVTTLDFGNIRKGLHSREFSVPRGTQLVLGQVQEGINAGDATYHTLGIAIRAEQTGDWRCRVIWQMNWGPNDALPTRFRFVRY